MWKILIAHIREEIYYSVIYHGPFPKEHKECCMETGETGDLLYIVQHILKESKGRRKI